MDRGSVCVCVCVCVEVKQSRERENLMKGEREGFNTAKVLSGESCRTQEVRDGVTVGVTRDKLKVTRKRTEKQNRQPDDAWGRSGGAAEVRAWQFEPSGIEIQLRLRCV